MATFIKAGYGFHVGENFDRAIVDIPIELAPAEFAKPRYTIGYIVGDPASRVQFLRAKRVRVHLPLQAIGEG